MDDVAGALGLNTKDLIPADSRSLDMDTFTCSASSLESKSALATSGMTLVTVDKRRRKSRSTGLISKQNIRTRVLMRVFWKSYAVGPCRRPHQPVSHHVR